MLVSNQLFHPFQNSLLSAHAPRQLVRWIQSAVNALCMFSIDDASATYENEHTTAANCVLVSCQRARAPTAPTPHLAPRCDEGKPCDHGPQSKSGQKSLKLPISTCLHSLFYSATAGSIHKQPLQSLQLQIAITKINGKAIGLLAIAVEPAAPATPTNKDLSAHGTTPRCPAGARHLPGLRTAHQHQR
jgi:hypothetical protein